MLVAPYLTHVNYERYLLSTNVQSPPNVNFECAYGQTNVY